MFQKMFRLKEVNTSISKELTAGLIVFFTAMFLIFVNPLVLSEAGMNINQAFISTCIIIFISCTIIAFATNLPLVLGPGLTISAIFVYDIVINNGYNYKIALFTVFLSGAITFLVFIFIPIKIFINSIPKNLKVGIVAGTGLFIVMLGLKLSGLIIPHASTLATLGNLKSIPVLFNIFFFFLLFICYNKKINLFPLITLLTFVIATGFNIIFFSNNETIQTTVKSLSFSDYFIPYFPIDFSCFKLVLIGVIITLFFASNFDAIGTYLSYNALKDQNAKEIGKSLLKRIFLIQGLSSMISGLLGCSNIVLLLESNTGVKAGGKTGLVPLTVGILFLLALFLKPLLGVIPSWGSGPILLTVGIFMFISSIKQIEWIDYTEYLPAILPILFIPLTYSVTNGIAIGILGYILIKFLSLKHKNITWLTYIFALIFLIYLLTK